MVRYSQVDDHGVVAQRTERQSPELKVVGSIPTDPAMPV